MTTYQFTLADTDGSAVGEGTMPVLPRFLHLAGGPDGSVNIEPSDDPNPTEDGPLVLTFARVGSSVWVHDDEFNCTDRHALFVKVDA